MHNTETTSDLVLLQRWLQAVMVSKGNLAQKIALAEKHYGLQAANTIIAGNLPVHTRLGIYASGYVLRLIDCIQADFPALNRFMGEDVFNGFARAYIIHRPSTSYTLFDLSKGFAEFLERTRPQDAPLGEEEDALLDLPIDLVRLERARLETLRSKGMEELPDAGEISSWDLFQQPVTLQLPETTQLLQLRFPLLEFYRELEKDTDPDPPEPELTFMLTARSNYRLSMAEITAEQFYFLSACREPVTIPEALAYAADKASVPSDELLAKLMIWLPQAVQNRWLRQVKI